MDIDTCANCGHPIKRATEGLWPWVHDDGVAVCPTATYAYPQYA